MVESTKVTSKKISEKEKKKDKTSRRTFVVSGKY